jgi:hypothetical protein
MIDMTIAILTHYPFQVLLMALVLRGALRAGLEELAGGRKGESPLEPIGTGTHIV